MIKNGLLVASFVFANYSLANSQILDLQVLCGSKFFESELSSESKKYFNEHIINKQIPNQVFNFSGKIVRNYDASDLHLKRFNFTNTKLININFRNANLAETIFNGTTFENVDFYGTDLKNVEFKDCKFIKCNLENTDLSETSLEKCKFKKVKLDGAELGHGLKFDTRTPHLGLVKLYAEFIKNEEKEKAKALNKIFGVLKLKLRNVDLRGLNLTDIDFHKANLHYTKLQGVRLSDHLELPYYQCDEELIQLYNQFIINGEVEKTETLNTIFRGLKLNLQDADLKYLDLRGINLSYADLSWADLTGANLTNANLKYTVLNTNNLELLKLSDTLTLDFNNINELFDKWREGGPNQLFYQKLVNAHVPLFEGVPYERLKTVDWSKLDLRNSNLRDLELKGCDFTNTNLKRASLYRVNLKNAKFNGANFKKIVLVENDLSFTSLIGVNLTEAFFRVVDLRKANLIGAKLGFKDLRKYRWIEVTLSKNLVINKECCDLSLEGVKNVLKARGVLIEQKKVEGNEPAAKKVKLNPMIK